MSAELKELRKSHHQLMGVSGALVDAGSIQVEPYDKAVRALTKERDDFRAALERIVALGGTPSGHELPSPGMAYVIAENAIAKERT